MNPHFRERRFCRICEDGRGFGGGGKRLGEDKVDVMLDLMLLSHCGEYPCECKTLNCIRKPIRHIFATVREQHNAEDIRAREKS